MAKNEETNHWRSNQWMKTDNFASTVRKLMQFS